MQVYFTELPSPSLTHKDHKYTSKQYKNGRWQYFYDNVWSTKITGSAYKKQMKEKVPESRTMRGGSVSDSIFQTIGDKLKSYKKTQELLKKYDKNRSRFNNAKSSVGKTIYYKKSKEADINYNTVKKQGLDDMQAAKRLTGLASAYSRQKKADEAKKNIAASKYYNQSLFGRVSYALGKKKALKKYGYRRYK